VGLPAPESAADANVMWEKGSYAFSEDYVRRIAARAGFTGSRLRCVKGFYDRSLTPELQAELKASPPAFVTIDVDYYSSTRDVLAFLKPILASGCVVFFDDLWAFDGHPDYGQLKALNEFNAANRDGRLVPHQVLGDRMYSYYRLDYEFAKGGRAHGG
jgi:O-methyltransferase